MLKNFNKHNVRQRSPANINSYKCLATFTGGAGRLSKRRSKRRSVNPAQRNTPLKSGADNLYRFQSYSAAI